MILPVPLNVLKKLIKNRKQHFLKNVKVVRKPYRTNQDMYIQWYNF